MKNILKFINAYFICLLITLCACAQETKNNNPKKTTIVNTDKKNNPYYSHTDTTPLNISDAEWQKVLPPEVFEVSRHGDTERPFTGKLWDFEGKGTYFCAACGNELFQSDAKFASSCGWPSFFEQSNPKSVVYKDDNSFGMKRIEALCGRCHGHLGHLFDDGPTANKKRYCMNSIVLDFEPFDAPKTTDNQIDTITLGGGCYWCVEAIYENLKGVTSVKSGFSGGNVDNPTYKEVCAGTTNHAEVVQITFDKNITSLDEIFKVFFTVHAPTTLNRQGADVGTQYRSVIFYKNETQQKEAQSIIHQLNQEKVYAQPIVTTVEPFKIFYEADPEHQNYYENNKNQPYCKMVIQPKIEKFEKIFKSRLKINKN